MFSSLVSFLCLFVRYCVSCSTSCSNLVGLMKLFVFYCHVGAFWMCVSSMRMWRKRMARRWYLYLQTAVPCFFWGFVGNAPATNLKKKKKNLWSCDRTVTSPTSHITHRVCVQSLTREPLWACWMWLSGSQCNRENRGLRFPLVSRWVWKRD